MFCSKCGNQLQDDVNFCEVCGCPTRNFNLVIQNPYDAPCKQEHQFNGIYKYTMWGTKKEVYCPRCGSDDCCRQSKDVIIPGKTKTRYTANLNPLKPFTIVNKKEKVVRNDISYTQEWFFCNSCGKKFK